MNTRRLSALAGLLTVLTMLTGLLLASGADGAVGAGKSVRSTPPVSAYVPKVGHVFVINIENKGYDETWGPGSKAPYLAKTLRSKGVLLNNYYGTAHNSQGNYIAQVSGQGPNPQMQADCQIFSDFNKTGAAAPGQLVGQGCVFPEGTPTLMRQMDGHRLMWRGYMQQMPRRCSHPAVGQPDPTQKATAKHNYAVRHNPFVYFHDVIDHSRYCARHVVPLGLLTRNLRSVRTTPKLSYITPDLCHDGHDNPCANGSPGGLAAVNRFLKVWAPKILQSPAFKRNGVLVITADESDGPQSDSSACCGEGASPNSPQPGIFGPGGGRIGALVISRWTRGGSWATTPYNHYSLLGSLEDAFRLGHLGYAMTVPDRFGLDIYNNGWQNR